MKAAIYARVSTLDQEPENQLQELRRYVEARGWTGGRIRRSRCVSGAKDRRPALDTLVADAKRRRFDVLVCWRLDRLGRNLRHLITLLEELQRSASRSSSLGEGIDATTPAGKAAVAHPRRHRGVRAGEDSERVKAGLVRARAQGRKLGRPELDPRGTAGGRQRPVAEAGSDQARCFTGHGSPLAVPIILAGIDRPNPLKT